MPAHLSPDTSRTALFSLACLGGALSLPFLMAHHHNPIPTFFQEWVAAAFGILAALVLWQRRLIQGMEIPRIALLPLGLIALLLIQYAAGLPQSNSRVLLMALYLLWSVLVMVNVCNLRRIVAPEKIARTAAWVIFAGALVSAALLALQLSHVNLDPGLVFPSPKGSGNLGQRNQLADYLWLGIVSAVFLRLEGRLGRLAFMTAVCGLIVASSLTGSRSVMLYAVGLAVLALWGAHRFKCAELRSAARITALLLCFTLLVQWILVHGGISSATQTEVSGARLFSEVHGTSQRLQLWRTGLAIFFDHPWLGAGVGQFPYVSYLTVGLQNDGSYIGGGEHAHNLFIQLLSEFGIGALLLLLLLGWQWWRAFIGTPWTRTHLWIASLLLVIGVHSQLEYPLWHTFFLGIASLALGLGSTEILRPQISRSGVAIIRLILVLAAVTSASLWIDYRHLENTLNSRNRDENGRPFTTSENVKVLSRLHRESLLSDYIPLAYAYMLDVNREALADKISVCETAIRFSPVESVTYKLAWLLALDGRDDDASQALRRAVATHPGYVPTAEKEIAKLSATFPALAWLTGKAQQMLMTPESRAPRIDQRSR